jgi:hypothetical protein
MVWFDYWLGTYVAQEMAEKDNRRGKTLKTT